MSLPVLVAVPHAGRAYPAAITARMRDSALAQLRLEAADFGWLTGELMRVARAQCQGRVVSLLEGGYDLSALGRSAAAHIKVLSDG